MVDPKSVEAQLKRIKFSSSTWGRAEVRELPNVLSPDEKIYECVNGMYDGGFALLVSTDMRVLLIDKKPLNYLTVEDLRFDMINELDYSHRLFGAQITISAGNKTLRFRSYNQQRLRKLINHVQDRMSEIKKEQADHQEDQKKHLMQINQQLQAYLLAQHQQMLQLQQAGKPEKADGQNPKPSPELSDYLFAQSLLREFGALAKDEPARIGDDHKAEEPAAALPPVSNAPVADELYSEGYREIFGKSQPAQAPLTGYAQQVTDFGKNLEINPLRIAYAKLPMALRNRKFGRPSFHAHSQATGSGGQSSVARA